MKKSPNPLSQAKPSSERPLQSPTDTKTAIAAGSAALLVASLMILWNLGAYALWGDEAVTALAGLAVLETGDTSAKVGHNVVAYREGLMLKEGKDRSTPPFAAYVAALSQFAGGVNSLAARLPFAIVGLVTVALLFFFLTRENCPNTYIVLCATVLCTQVAFFLYSRQCRHYSLAILFTVLTVYSYLGWQGQWKRGLLLGLSFWMLFAANYFAAVAIAGALAADALVWRRKEILPMLRGSSFAVAGLTGVACALVALVWNPLTTGFGSYQAQNSLADRLEMLWWYFRDFNATEMGSLLLIVLAGIAGAMRRIPWPLRGIQFYAAFTVLVAMLTPQIRAGAQLADVRYLSPILPLSVLLSAAAFWLILPRRPRLAFMLCAVAGLTNIVQGAPWLAPIRSTVAAYVRELAQPPREPISPTAAWLNENSARGASVWVIPDYMAHSLMYHAPRQVYAWQLRPDQRSEAFYRDLPDIHFKGLAAPDYIVIFGPALLQIVPLFDQFAASGVRYTKVHRVGVFWKDLYRPELFWRSFDEIRNYNVDTEDVYIFQRLPY